MAIFGTRKPFSPKVLPPQGASQQSWDDAALQLAYSRGAVGELVDKFERFEAEQARRKLGGLRLTQAGGRNPVTEIAPDYSPVACDVCRTRLPLAQMREIIQWRDTRLTEIKRVWYACSLGCSQFVQRTLHEKPARRATPLEMAQPARRTIPLIDRGRA